MVKITITGNEENQRLDRFLRKYLRQAPLSSIYKIIRKDVKLNGKRAREDVMLCRGDELTLYISDEQLTELSMPLKKRTAKKQFKIAYEDDSILIVDKPWGLLTHGDSFEKKNTLVNQVCGYLQQQGEYDPVRERTFTPAPVNRLDRNTTGLVIFGKKAESLRALTELIRNRSDIRKFYMTMVYGSFREEICIEDSLAKDRKNNLVKVAGDSGKKAVTVVKPITSGERYSLVEVELVTGRTHQIRAHMAHRGYPLIGDIKYGNSKVNYLVKKEFGLTTQMLHAYRLEFGRMPKALKALENKIIEAELPQEFQRVMKGLDLCTEE